MPHLFAMSPHRIAEIEKQIAAYAGWRARCFERFGIPNSPRPAETMLIELVAEVRRLQALTP